MLASIAVGRELESILVRPRLILGVLEVLVVQNTVEFQDKTKTGRAGALNHPGFTGCQYSLRIRRYETDIKDEKREAIFTRVPRARRAAGDGTASVSTDSSMQSAPSATGSASTIPNADIRRWTGECQLRPSQSRLNLGSLRWARTIVAFRKQS